MTKMTSPEAYMIIDIGTGNVRVAIIGTDGTMLCIERTDIRYHKDENYPEALYFEPYQLWQQITGLARTALEKLGDVVIVALTATSQREGIVLIDKNGGSQIGLPNIDHRGREWEPMISDKSQVYKLTGRYPTSLFSAMKLVGIREKRKEIWNELSTFLSISDWVQYMLSGILHYEHSQASETLLYDVELGHWSEELCAVFNLETSMLAPLKSSGTLLGKITAEQAANLNISADAVVVIGGADTQLAILSTQPETNDMIIISGTTTPVIKVTGDYVIDQEERTWTSRHVQQSLFMFEANAGVTGLNYQRLKEIFYPNEEYSVIEAELAGDKHMQVVASLGSLLAGEKSPLLKGGFIFDAPVSHQLSRAGFVWAILWDIACSIFENYKTLSNVSPHTQDYVWACGGGLQSHTLLKFIASLLGKKVLMRNNFRDASVAGGALICDAALGKISLRAETPEVVLPGEREHFAALYERWKVTRASFKNISS